MTPTDKAIARIRQAHDIASGMGNTLFVAYSGGKDSDVLLDLAIKSGVTFAVNHNHTTADAPETVLHIRDVFKKLNESGINAIVSYPETSMWRLIEKKGMPPTRIVRYCCYHLKERRFDGQHLLMGIRWAESAKRKTRGLHERITGRKENTIKYMDENDDSRKLTEICQLRGNIATNPIIDWSDRQLWAYIRENGIAMNPLYSQGLTRVGCIGCPMASVKQRCEQFRRYPKYKQMFMDAFKRMLAHNRRIGRKCSWDTPDDVYTWWMKAPVTPAAFRKQTTLDEFMRQTSLDSMGD